MILVSVHEGGTDICSTLHLDGFWSRGVGNEGAVRLPEDEGA